MSSILKIFDPASNTWKDIPAIKGDKGDKGDKGERGVSGIQGAPFLYENFTQEQLAELKGDKGEQGYSPSVEFEINNKGELSINIK